MDFETVPGLDLRFTTATPGPITVWFFGNVAQLPPFANIKFTDRVEVVVRVESVCRSEEDILLEFTVADTGIGIPPEKQKMIFEAFTRADSSKEW